MTTRARNIEIRWIDYNGNARIDHHDSVSAHARLAYLDMMEMHTQKVAPTDSGLVRRAYLEEAAAIRSALSRE